MLIHYKKGIVVCLITLFLKMIEPKLSSGGLVVISTRKLSKKKSKNFQQEVQYFFGLYFNVFPQNCENYFKYYERENV